VSNVLSVTNSSIVALTLSTADPAVAIPPQNATVNYGGSATFSIVPYGTGPFTYQWLMNGSPLNNGPTGSGSIVAGATSSNLTISGVSCADSGSYSVILADGHGSVPSSNGVLTVNDPYISVQPSNQLVLVGGTVEFSTGVAGTPALSYQWLSNGVAMSDGGAVSGSTTTNLTITSVTSGDAGNYALQVSGGCGSNVYSAPATLIPVYPPQSRTVSVGENVVFVVGGGSTFQWSYNGTPINGANNSAYVVTNAQLTSAGTYTVLDTGFSVSATLSVIPGRIHLFPTNLVVLRAGDGNGAQVGTGTPLYIDQFTTNGTYLDTIMVPSTTPSACVAYDGVTDDYMTSSANNQYLVFAGFNTPLPYTASSALNSATAAQAPRAIATVNGLGYYTLNVVDSTNGALTGGTRFNGATSSDGVTQFWSVGGAGVLHLTPGGYDSTLVASGRFEVDIYNGNLYACLGSSSRLVEFNGIPTAPTTPAVLLQQNNNPNDFAFSPDGQTIYLTDGSNVEGGVGGVQRWDYNSGSSSWVLSYTIPTPLYGPAASTSGNNGPDGLAVDYSQFTGSGAPGTNAILYVTTGEGTQDNLVRIIDGGNNNWNINIIASVGPNQTIRGIRFGPVVQNVGITTQPLSQTNNAGNNVTFTAAATGSIPLFYQWQFDGTNIAGANLTSLTVTNIQATNAGTYTVTVTNDISVAASSNAVLTVLSSGPAAPQFTGIAELAGGSVQLTFSGTAGSAYRLWGSTNIALAPITSTWVLLTSGTFGASPVTFTDSTNSVAARFYAITTP
jgi:hypothetical protein